MKELVRDSNILVENFRPTLLPSVGLDYEELSRVNP
jgi:crotonobetainyl-CoA:carnitine CoA-transferase CaiB-like acyl-CoA transferase